jgi:hypothetical protein
MSKKTIMAVIIITALLTSLTALTVACAQTTPSVPEFTLKLVDNSTVEFIIRNQPLATDTSNSNLTLFHQLRFKNHDSENYPNIHSIDTYHVQSTFTISLYPFYNTITGQLVDFQIQAIIGHYSDTYNPNLNNFPGMPKGGYEIVFDPVVSSGWSNTETLNLTNGAVSTFGSPSITPSVSPTQQPTIEPSQTPDRPKVGDFAPVIIPASMIFLGIIFVGLLVFFSKHRRNK